MFWKSKPVENPVPDAVKPPENVLAEFKDLAMITWVSSWGGLPAQWVNWAIDYVGSDMDYSPSFKDTTFKELRVLHKAALKYAEESGND